MDFFFAGLVEREPPLTIIFVIVLLQSCFDSDKLDYAFTN